MLTFVGAIIVQFVQAPSPKPALQRALATGSPVELASQVILTQHNQRSLNHRVWQRVANLLLRDEDPYARLVELDEALGDEPQESIAATGYSAYYTGYALLLLKAHEQAELCWEFGLQSFEKWSDERRPWLDGNDTLYHSRTLMRLGRDEEAYAVLRDLPDYTAGVPESLGTLVGLTRTLGEIGHEDEAKAMFHDFLDRQDERGQNQLIRTYINGGRTWGTSFEHKAARMALDSSEEALLRLLPQETSFRSWLHIATRDLVVEFRRRGSDDRSAMLRDAGERAALRVTDDPSVDALLVADAWRWIAKYRALGNDPLGAAGAIRRITPGLIHPDELISDPDLAPYLDVAEVLEAIGLHGEPGHWGSGAAD